MATLLLGCVFLFLWGGYTFLPPAAQKYTREIVHDYDIAANPLTAPLDGQSTIQQTMYAQGRLYGVRLSISTFNRVPRGTLHLSLLSSQGAEAARADVDMSTLLDNTFHAFIFNQPVEAADGEWFTLVLTATPETPDDTLGVHRSQLPPQDFVNPETGETRYPLGGFTLQQNNQPQQGMLALQYITRYAGGASSFIFGAYAFFAAFLTALLLGLYGMIFVLRAPLHRVFLLAAGGLGFVFAFLTPPRTAPDEYVHIATSYRYANRIIGRQEQGDSTQLTVRAGDEMMLYNYDTTATDIFAYQDLAENLFTRTPGGPDVVIPARTAAVFPLLYALPTAGVWLAQLLGVSKYALLLAGRLLNLAFYVLVVSRAIKKMPFARPMLFTAALLPMCLQLAASFSYDTWLLALGFYFSAACLRYAYGRRKPLGAAQLALLGVLAILIAPAKTVYVMMIPLLLLIPPALYKSKKQCWLARGGIFAASAVMWMLFNLSGFLSATGSPLSAAPQAAAPPAQVVLTAAAQPHTPASPPAHGTIIQDGIEIGSNGDALQFFSLRYILTHPLQTIKIALRTLWEQGPLWLQGLIGGRLGEIIAIKIEINWLFTIGLLGTLLTATLTDREDRRILQTRQRAFTLSIALVVAALFCFACLLWTPINYTTIFGIQGRYFLPVLPLALLALRGTNLRFYKPVWRQLALAACVLVVLCQMDGFFKIISR